MKIRTDRRSRNVVLEVDPHSPLPPIPLAGLHLRRILVPVDFSECSRKAVRYAVSLARQFQAEITLLHVVVSIPTPPQAAALESEPLVAHYREDASSQLSKWRLDIAAVPAHAAVRDGTSAHFEIVTFARECNSDLIVIGNQGRTGLARMFLGSTAEQVVRHAPCPVLVIRDREHEFVEGAENPA